MIVPGGKEAGMSSAVTTNVQGAGTSGEPVLMYSGNPAKVCGHRTSVLRQKF
jgi:hypothetical protein